MRTPNVIRLDQIGPRDTYVVFYDGSAGAGWEILPDVTGPDPLRTTGKAIELTGGRGIRFPTRRIKYLSGLKLGEITGSAIRVNVGLTPEQLGGTPADFMPDVPRA